MSQFWPSWEAEVDHVGAEPAIGGPKKEVPSRFRTTECDPWSPPGAPYNPAFTYNGGTAFFLLVDFSQSVASSGLHQSARPVQGTVVAIAGGSSRRAHGGSSVRAPMIS